MVKQNLYPAAEMADSALSWRLFAELLRSGTEFWLRRSAARPLCVALDSVADRLK
ncbi:hypothetical protein [Roseovarius nubinhibens]|uniref:hypothetical protein n=1 Tax=Roseovarius nubinhibens TaxID=314263 RepID=UPI0030EBB3F3